jgi:hypothetical protein
MGIILDTLAKRGEATNCSAQASTPQGAREFMKAAHPMVKTEPDVFARGNDQPTTVTSATGSVSGDVSQQDEGTDVDVLVPLEDTFSQKVRELVTSAGQYNAGYKQHPPATKVDRRLVQAVDNLAKNAGFLNRLVTKTNARRAAQGKPPIGSASGSVTGTTIGA